MADNISIGVMLLLVVIVGLSVFYPMTKGIVAAKTDTSSATDSFSVSDPAAGTITALTYNQVEIGSENITAICPA